MSSSRRRSTYKARGVIEKKRSKQTMKVGRKRNQEHGTFFAKKKKEEKDAALQ